jgi:putative sterol carrier protein
LDSRFDDLARGLDPSKSPVGDPTISNLPVDSIGWSSENNKWRKWNGSAWVSLVVNDLYAINISGNAATVTNGVYTTGTQTIGGSKTFSSVISGSIDGNAATVTGGVYTSGNQTIAGIKTFSSTIVGSINGNAATVTGGVYTSGDQTIAGIKTFSSKITGSISGNCDGNAATATSAATATTATTATKATSLQTTGWVVEEVGTVLQFKYGGIVKMTLDIDGNIKALGDIEAYSTI